jgi:steroid delta-isomerase
MASPEALLSIVETYVTAYNTDDPDLLGSLLADSAVLVDPVGTDAHVGRAAIRAFWDMVHGLSGHIGLTAKHVFVCGGEVGMIIEIEAAGMILDAIDIFTFDDDGKITSVRAYWDLAQARS